MHLSSNQIKSLDSSLLQSLQQLEDVDISRNELDQLPPQLFQGTSIHGSKIALHVLCDYTTGLVKLKSIKLNDNNIKVLPPGLLRGLANVEVLQLQNNQIAELPEKIFDDLGSMTQLILTGNSLIRIVPGVFSR